MKNKPLQNHIAIAIDVSSSMQYIINEASRVLNNIIENLKRQSVEFDQETRVSIYTFNSNIECLVYDMDVLRCKSNFNLKASGMTALYEVTGLVLKELGMIPELHCDHSFLVYLITDGDDTCSKINPSVIKNTINQLPDNYSIIGLAPNAQSRLLMERMGLSKGNVDLWDTTVNGLKEVEKRVIDVSRGYFTMRSQGVRSSQTMMSLKDLDVKTAKKVLKQVNAKAYSIVANHNAKAVQIRDLVESSLNTSYKLGSAFYELVKTEHIQPQKKIAIQNKKTQAVYTGDEARQMLGLPQYEVKVKPEDHGDWNVYVQSTSVNRNVIPDQKIIYFNGAI